MINKVAVVIGHTKDSKGASSLYLPAEFDYNSKVAKELKRLNPHMYDVFEHDTYKYGYTKMVQKVSDKINQGKYDLVIELHYNAASPSANGCETLYYFSSQKGREYAIKFSAGIAGGMKVHNRGIRALVNSGDRGFQAVFTPKPPALILEPFFGTNAMDCSKFANRENVYAAVINAIVEEL